MTLDIGSASLNKTLPAPLYFPVSEIIARVSMRSGSALAAHGRRSASSCRSTGALVTCSASRYGFVTEGRE